MATFTYTGEDATGNKVTETVEVADRYAVYEVARQNGHSVAGISEAGGGLVKQWLSVEKIEYMISRVKDDEVVMMTRNLGSMLVAGLPLSRALSVIERQSTNPKLKGVLKDVREQIEKGEQFNTSLAKYPNIFSDLYISMVKAGEESGMLAESLSTLALQMEKASNLKKKIKGAMMYPAIVIVIMAIIGVLMMIYVMPSITGTFVKLGVDLPTTTKILIATSNFMVNNTILVIGGMIGGVAGFLYSLRTKYGKIVFHWFIIHLPVIGNLVKETNAARTARTLSSLLHSGVDVIRSLNITEEVIQNVYYKPIIQDAAERVEKGTALSETFIENNKLYPVLVGEMILVGEETGQIAQMLEQLATFYETEVENKTKDLSTIIEPLLMVVIGGTVGFFALAMIAPIYSIGDSIG